MTDDYEEHLDEPTLSEADGVRYLHFGTHWVQGAMRVSDPYALELEYTRQMMVWLLYADPPRGADAIGLLGLGAGSLARFCLKQTRSQVQVVEWNPQVTLACMTFFRLPEPGKRLHITHADAGAWVEDPLNRGTCPVLMVDLYDADALGPVRDSVEFYTGCRDVVGEQGIITVNLFGDHDSFPRNIENLNTAFDGRVALLPEIDAGNRVALAFGAGLQIPEPAVLMARAEAIESRYGLPARRWAKSLMGGRSRA